MKKISIMILTACTLATGACTGWLDVKPSVESPAKETFASQEGFVDVLTGAYIRMKDNRIYGRHLTWNEIEFYAQHWDGNGQVVYNALKAYDYLNATVETRNNEMYEYLYKVIADVNGILEVIDSRREVFDEGYYEIIKGEALALRAYCHLDLLRLFGPVPDMAEQGRQVLPYVKTIGKQPHPYETFDGFAALLIDDLDEAESLLEVADPVLRFTIGELNPSREQQQAELDVNDPWLLARQVRMNYYAVLALRARACLWTGDRDGAARYADMVIEAVSHTGETVFRLGNDTDFNAGDYALSPEHIFALKDPRLADVQEYGIVSQSSPASSLRADNVLARFREPAVDIRTRYLWKEYTGASGFYYPIKYQQVEEPRFTASQLPLIRLSEMYLIAAEAAGYEAGTPTLNEFFRARGGSAMSFADEQAFRDEIVREYNREFWAEGQAFYAYKRVNARTIAGYANIGNKPMEQVYVVPRPQREINFNNN